MGIEVDFLRDDGSRSANGVKSPPQLGPYGEVYTCDVAGYNATRIGIRYYLNTTAQTIAATHNSPLAAATATPIVGIVNPLNSGYAAVIEHGWFTTVSGTPPASSNPSWNFATGISTISTNPSGTIVNGLIGSNDVGSMRAYNNVALTGLGVATGQVGLIKHWGGAVFAGAVAANHDQGYVDNTNGGIIVPPGCGLFVLAGSAAGTSWVVAAGMSWREINWPL